MSSPATASATPAPARASGPQRALHKLGLTRPIDLALHLPLRYEDQTRLQRMADLRVGEWAQVQGQVVQHQALGGPRRQLLVTLADDSGRVVLRFFNAHPGLTRALALGQVVRVRGEVHAGPSGPTLLHPALGDAQAPLAQTLTPVYPSTAALPQAYLRKAVQAGLAQANLDECVPPDYLQKIGLQGIYSLREALLFLHHPPPNVALEAVQQQRHPAWQRLKAEELLAQQVSQTLARQTRARQRAPVLAASEPAETPLVQRLHAALPFELTPAQARVTQEIAADLARPQPMHRLLQGDVGAGKTVVAALAAAQCMAAGWQCALMVPTEILASQHVSKLVTWLTPLGVSVVWLLGSQGARERREALAQIADGRAQLVVGTQALIQHGVRFARLGLVIIDEQHRFGVAQRLALRGQGQARCNSGPDGASDLQPHLLMMTATPIPRTLAMSYYADLDVSTLDTLPPGRTPVVTRAVHAARRAEVMARLGAQVAQGRQAYWVCPLIEDSEALDLHNATQTHAELCQALPGVRVGLLHARLTRADKQTVMAEFAAGVVQVLVSTTVIEVGVDVPNASLMVIEHAERFGLSQLHQLRGRVGRGAVASACVLLYDPGEAPRLGQTAQARLQAMVATQDGFEIARLDLEIRGPGEFMGARQSGDAMLRFADVVRDAPLLDWARDCAPRLIAQHPALAQRLVQRWLGGRTQYLQA
ncbi:MAG: ATP-dependent DNA helicase RecG [Rhodoferax sp.]